MKHSVENSHTAKPSPPAKAGQYGALSNAGTYFVSYTPAPDPIPQNKMFELTVWVSPAADRTRLAQDVGVQADAAMPEHDHGMNTKPKVTANPDGSFKVRGMQFHMSGYWQLYLDVTRAGVTERAQFDVNLD